MSHNFYIHLMILKIKKHEQLLEIFLNKRYFLSGGCSYLQAGKKHCKKLLFRVHAKEQITSKERRGVYVYYSGEARRFNLE